MQRNTPKNSIFGDVRSSGSYISIFCDERTYYSREQALLHFQVLCLEVGVP